MGADDLQQQRDHPCLETLMLAEKLLPAETMMSVIGIGAVQTPLAAASMLLGHHIRTGLEDNVYYSKECWPRATLSSGAHRAHCPRSGPSAGDSRSGP